MNRSKLCISIPAITLALILALSPAFVFAESHTDANTNPVEIIEQEQDEVVDEQLPGFDDDSAREASALGPPSNDFTYMWPRP